MLYYNCIHHATGLMRRMEPNERNNSQERLYVYPSFLCPVCSCTPSAYSQSHGQPCHQVARSSRIIILPSLASLVRCATTTSPARPLAFAGCPHVRRLRRCACIGSVHGLLLGP